MLEILQKKYNSTIVSDSIFYWSYFVQPIEDKLQM